MINRKKRPDHYDYRSGPETHNQWTNKRSKRSYSRTTKTIVLFFNENLGKKKKAAFVLLVKHQIITNEGRKSAGSNRFRPEMVTNFQQVQQNPFQRFDK